MNRELMLADGVAVAVRLVAVASGPDGVCEVYRSLMPRGRWFVIRESEPAEIDAHTALELVTPH